MKTENCPYAYRILGDPNVHCKKIREIPYVRWTYCAHQYDCRATGRWEAPESAAKCKFRKKEEN